MLLSILLAGLQPSSVRILWCYTKSSCLGLFLSLLQKYRKKISYRTKVRCAGDHLLWALEGSEVKTNLR